MFKISYTNIIYLILYAIPNTILTFSIVYIINNVISQNTSFLVDYMGIVFVAAILYSYLLNVHFQKKLIAYAFEILYENEKRVFDEMLKTPYLTLQKLGHQRFYTTIEDLRVFSGLPQTVTHTVSSLLMLLLCMGYLFTLSIAGGTVIIVLILVISGVYFLVINAMADQVAELRMYNESYYKYVNDLIQGFKELKMSYTRRKTIREQHLYPNRDDAKKLDFKISLIFLSINFISQYGLYIVIAVILFLLPELGLLDRKDVISYVVVLMFISGPINNLINMQNVYTRFIIANRRIKKFLKDFKNLDPQAEELDEILEFESLEFSNVSFSYEEEEEKALTSFALGPIDLSIEKGEIIFVVGGNGSGKSTFINVLTGLYVASKGEIILNGQTRGNTRASIQKLSSAIFTNNYLFHHNYDEYTLEDNPVYTNLLKTMKMDKEVTQNSEDAARRYFSKGQSKRMSMIFALLENKPILIMDEWAADQDPHFRKYFYEELLPMFKRAGKTIIAVTHDDAYFKHADRILKFDYGKIVKNVKVNNEILATENLWFNTPS